VPEAPPQSTVSKQRHSVAANDDSGIVDFKGILRKYRGDRQIKRKGCSMQHLPGGTTEPASPRLLPKAEPEAPTKVDKETIEGKKTATVKDRARLRDLIKNI